MIDFSTLKELYLDGKKVTSLFLDGYEVPFGEETPKYFTVTALDQPTNVVIMSGAGTPPAFSLEYSRFANLWSSYSAAQTITLAAGESVMFRRVGNATTIFSSSSSAYWKFSFSSSVKVSGNIMSLLDASMQRTSIGTYVFYNLFKGNSNLVDASQLQLPATTLANFCYYGMFQNCSSLMSAPALPATTLANSCYNYMFSGCSSLTSAPALPATTLAGNCYQRIFSNCTSLPKIEVAFSTWTSSTNNWVSNVASSGTFICPTALGTDATIQRGASYCPEGWTVVNSDAS